MAGAAINSHSSILGQSYDTQIEIQNDIVSHMVVGQNWSFESTNANILCGERVQHASSSLHEELDMNEVANSDTLLGM